VLRIRLYVAVGLYIFMENIIVVDADGARKTAILGRTRQRITKVQ